MEKDKITPEEFLELEIKINQLYNDGDLIIGPFANQNKTTSDLCIKFPIRLSINGSEIVDSVGTFIYSKGNGIFAKNLNRQPNNSYTII
jgi:hypothetical protein